jgi:hypothetical protein
LRQKSPAVKRGQALLGGLSFPWFVCVQRRLANSPVFALALSIHTGAGMKVHAKEESRQVKRFYRVMERQRENAWAQDYIPGVLATREEAPSVSKTSRIYWPRVGRDLHALSEPETALLLLAIHHPQTFDVNEQRLLQPVPAPHPLSGHPVHGGLTRPRFEGTLNVAERLGMSTATRRPLPGPLGGRPPALYRCGCRRSLLHQLVGQVPGWRPWQETWLAGSPSQRMQRGPGTRKACH